MMADKTYGMRNSNNESNFKIKIIENGEETETYYLYVVESFEISGSNNIVINESATGNSGISYNTGRLHEEIPVNGVLLATSRDSNNVINSKEVLKNKIDTLFRYEDQGKVINFITPYSSAGMRSNQYYIKSLNFTFNPGEDDKANFSMVLSENRTANVKSTQVSLINFGIAEFYKDYYRKLTGATQ